MPLPSEAITANQKSYPLVAKATTTPATKTILSQKSYVFLPNVPGGLVCSHFLGFFGSTYIPFSCLKSKA
jgi:hypothetical protein